MNARDQYDGTNSDEVGLVVQALSVGVNKQTDVEGIMDLGLHAMYAIITVYFLSCRTWKTF